MFQGSYYDPSPWTDQACAAAYAVPAGCPLPFVTAGYLDPAEVSVTAARGSAAVAIDATLMLDGSADEPINGAKDVYSCTCDPMPVTATFDRYEVDAASTEPGDFVTVELGALGTLQFAIDPAGTCPAIDWPTELDASIACDDCPVDDPGNGNADDRDGCDATGGASLWVGLAALALVRRRSYNRASSSRLRV